jgi:hypothetical protein
LCLKDAYELLDNGLKASEYGLFDSSNGPFSKAMLYVIGLEIRGSMLLEGSLYGGVATGCAAQAAGFYAACLADGGKRL